MSEIKKHKSPFHATHAEHSADFICELVDNERDYLVKISKYEGALLKIAKIAKRRTQHKAILKILENLSEELTYE